MTYAPKQNTVQVSTHDLKEGDILSHYGALLILSDRKVHAMTASDYQLGGDTITFHCEMIDGHNGSIPLHWLNSEHERDRYHIQGNKLAMWAKVI